MSDLNDDLLNYELGDDILLDPALYGADEDELLLSDDDLEKNESKEEKRQLKAEAEEWVKSKIQKKTHGKNSIQEENATKFTNNTVNEMQNDKTTTNTTVLQSEDSVSKTTTTEAFEVSSTAGTTVVSATDTVATLGSNATENSQIRDDVSTSDKKQTRALNKNEKEQGNKESASEKVACATTEEVSSSSYKDQGATISCSNLNTNSSLAVIESNAQDYKDLGSAGSFTDPREDCEEERDEERTNIKTTNERDMETLEPSQEKHHSARFMHGKRLPRTHGSIRNMGSYGSQRPLLRFPPVAHGNFPLINTPSMYSNSMTAVVAPNVVAVTAAASTLTHTHTSSLIPGQFQLVNPMYTQSPQNPSANTQNANTQHTPTTTSTPSVPPHQHEPMRPVRHPYAAAGFRPAVPPIPGHFRQHNPNNPIFSHGPHPHEYVPTAYGPNTFMSNPMGMHVPRGGIYRGELPPLVGGPPGTAPGMRPVLRLPRPQLQNMAQPNYGPLPQALRHPLPPQGQPSVVSQTQQANSLNLGVHASGSGVNMPASTGTQLRPSKVLINPNFKGGVEAATNKFIKETQYMASIGAPIAPQIKSDEELLRQQEEFINKNRQHIEKRRQERFSPLSSSRRSTSRSRSRSRSRERERDRERERSYSPTMKRSGVSGNYFERDRERERERDRDRDRSTRGSSRDRERERNIGNANNALPNRNSNRFRRGNSRDRDYDHRSNNYSKRRRSLSPNRSNFNANGRRGGDKERNEVEEDEETRAYRLEIEKQKALREKILRDKELKRRRAAEEKFHEDKQQPQQQPAQQQQQPQQQQQQTQSPQKQYNPQQEQQQQKLKPLIVTERKIITLKKRANDEQQQKQQEQQTANRKQVTTAKILPEGKRTLTGHLIGGRNNINSTITTSEGAGGNEINKTSLEESKIVNVKKSFDVEVHELATPSDDEVELDYDEDELMLEEEDRLLASPTPPPTSMRSPSPQQRSITTTSTIATSTRNNNSNNRSHKNGNSSTGTNGSRLTTPKSTTQLFNASNRRVVLKSATSISTSSSSSTSTATAATTGAGVGTAGGAGANRREQRENEKSNSTQSTYGRSRGNNSSSNHREHIFDRLDAGNKRNKSQQQHQRVVIKHS